MTTNNPDLKTAFEKANPEIWKKIQGDLNKIKQARHIEERARALRERMKGHVRKHRKNWVAREALKLFEEREHPVLKHPVSRWAENRPRHVSDTEEARRKVQNRIANRMNRISKIKQRMQNRLAPGHDENQNPTNLKSKVISIVNRTQSIRSKSRQHFSRHKDQWIKSAQEKGSKNSERDVFKKQRDRLSCIDQAEHRLIHEAFKEHGQPLPQTRKQNLAHEFNQSMG